MNDLTIGRDGNRTRHLDSSADVVLYDVAMTGRDGDKTLAILRFNMATRNTNIGRNNFLT